MAELRYEGPFDRAQVSAAGEWFTAAQGDTIDATGDALDAFRKSSEWVETEAAGVMTTRNTPPKRKRQTARESA